MKEINLEVVNREKIGKSNSKNLRNDGKVPAIIYGDKKESNCIFLECLDIMKEMSKTGFFSTVFNLNINKKKIKVLPREVQTDPLNNKPIHIDFLRVTPESKINISVPVIFFNEDESPGLKSGGVLNTVRRDIDLICKIKNIPEKLEANLKDLEVGSVVHMSDIILPEGVLPVIADRDFTIATIAAPTIMTVEEEKPETEGEEGEEGAEGAEGEEGAEVKEGEEGSKEGKSEETKETEAKKEQDPKK